MLPNERRIAFQILNGELFYLESDFQRIERALEEIGCVESAPVIATDMGCRTATEKGLLLLDALQHEGDAGPVAAQLAVLLEFVRAVAANRRARR